MAMSARTLNEANHHDSKLSINKKLMPISKMAIKADRELLFPIYDVKGNLLIEKGVTLDQVQILKIAEKGSLFTLKNDLLMAMNKIRGAVDEEDGPEVYKAKTPFGILHIMEQQLENIYRQPDDPFTLSNLLGAAGRVQTVCENWPDAVLAKIFIDDKSNYTMQHSIHAAILCELVTRSLHWQPEKRRQLIGAALTMNISLGFKQDQWQSQREPLSEKDRTQLQRHPIESAKLLAQIGIEDIAWLEYVSAHHEELDGTGYPIGFSGDDMSKGSKILRMADTYGAKISGRHYRKGITPSTAAKQFFGESEEKISKELTAVFLKSVGLYPPGSVVELVSRELAIVTKRGKKITSPIVRCIANSQNQRLGIPITRNTEQGPYKITKTTELPPNFGPLDIDKLWGF